MSQGMIRAKAPEGTDPKAALSQVPGRRWQLDIFKVPEEKHRTEEEK